MNLRGLQEYLTNGAALSVGTPNEATAYKAPQLNTAQILATDFHSGITGGAFANVIPAVPFYLTDNGPGGIPYVQIKQAVCGHSVMTNLTFTKLPFLVSQSGSTAAFGKLKLLTMPFGRFSISGGSAIFTTVDWSNAALSYVKSSTTLGSGVGATGSGDFSVGTVGNTDTSLTSTDVDIVASTAFVDPFVAGIGSNLATPGAVLNGPTEFDGSTTTTSSTQKTINLNVLVDSGDTTANDANMILLTGFLRIYTQWLGDF